MRWRSGAISVAKYLGLTLGTLMVALGLGEILFQLFLKPPPKVSVRLGSGSEIAAYGHAELTLQRIPDKGGLYIATDSGLRLRPNARALLKNERLSGRTIEIRTNSLGYRGPEVDVKRGTRILFLGDSITFANYMAEEETFVHLVGTLGAERGKTWNTINAGIGTISLGDELSILKETGLSIKPDIVVLNFYLNDFQSSPGIFLPQLPRWLDWSQLAHRVTMALGRRRMRTRRSASAETIIRQLEQMRPTASGKWQQDIGAFNSLIIQSYHDWGGAWSEEAWKLMMPLVEELYQLSIVYGFQLVFVAHPVVYQVQAEFVEDWPQRRLSEVGKRLAVPTLDLLPALRRHKREELFYDQCHHTPRGARIVAEAITDFLVQVEH